MVLFSCFTSVILLFHFCHGLPFLVSLLSFFRFTSVMVCLSLHSLTVMRYHTASSSLTLAHAQSGSRALRAKTTVVDYAAMAGVRNVAAASNSNGKSRDYP